jgi:hypothetical protein
MAERAVRPTMARQGELMMIGKAATTSHRTVVRESWAEPPFPPSPEPPLPPPLFPPSPPTSSGEGCTGTGAWEEGQAVDPDDTLKLHPPSVHVAFRPKRRPPVFLAVRTYLFFSSYHS